MTEQHVYDTSQIKKYMTCPFAYYIRYVCGLKLADVQAKEYDLEFGKNFHNALEHYYTYLKTKQGSSTVDLNALWAGYTCPEGEVHKTKEGGILLIKNYFKRWHEIDKNMKVLDVERVRTIDIGDYKFIVKLDTEIEVQNNNYSLEHKTASSIKMGYFDAYFMDCQITAQAAAIKQLYENCSGVMVNAASVRYYKKKYKDRDVGFHTDYQRSIVNRTPMEIEDWKKQMSAWIEAIEADKKKGFFRKSCQSLACNAYRGTCQYANICKSSNGMEVDEQIVETMYEFIDPYEYLNETLEIERNKQDG